MQRLSDFLNRLCLGTSIVLLAGMTIMVLVQVVGRYVIASPPAWTEEAARYLLVWLAFLGATCAFHGRVDPKLAIGQGPGDTNMGRLLCFGRLVAVILFIAPWLIFAPGFLQRHFFRISDSLEINSAFLVAIVPISGAVILVHLAAQLTSRFPRYASDSQEQEGAPF